MERARDFAMEPERFQRYIRGQLPVPPPGGAGVVGFPTRATPEKGQAIYERLLDVIRRALFGEAAEEVAEEDTDTM
jgi:creatinine amidohydrolase/Fe(II)-dependent formamide hydrolase-like protein